MIEDITNDQNVSELLRASNRAATIAQAGKVALSGVIEPNRIILLPHESDESHLSEGGVYLPNTHSQPKQLAIPDSAMVSKVKPDSKPLSSQEIALATMNVPRFLAQKIAKQVPKDKGYNEVLSVLIATELQDPIFLNSLKEHRSIPYLHCSEAVLERQAIRTSYFNRETNEKEEYTRTIAGPLEQVSLQIIDEIERNSVLDKKRCFLALLNVLRSYCSLLGLKEIPTLPELTDRIVQLLTHAVDSDIPVLCKILEKFAMTPEQAENILNILDEKNALQERLAFKLDLNVSKEKSDSLWIVEQSRRRAELLSLLQVSPQQALIELPELKRLASHIVTSQNLRNSVDGRVGYEIEFISDLPREKVPIGFILETDGTKLEIKVARESSMQWLNWRYYQRMYELSVWLEEANAKPLSLHLHFDQSVHQYRPTFYLRSEDGYGVVDARKGQNTFEHRGLVIPISQSKNSFDPESLSDTIALLTFQSQKQQSLPPETKLKPIFSLPESTTRCEDFIFGHIAAVSDNPKVRLATLMALRNPYSLRAMNIFSLLETFDKQSLADYALRVNSSQMDELGFSKDQIDQFQIIGLYCNEFGWNTITSKFSESVDALACFLSYLADTADPAATLFLLKAVDEIEVVFDQRGFEEILPLEIELLKIATQLSGVQASEFFHEKILHCSKSFRKLLLSYLLRGQIKELKELSNEILFKQEISEEIREDFLDLMSCPESIIFVSMLEKFLNTSKSFNRRMQAVTILSGYSYTPTVFTILLDYYHAPNTIETEKIHLLKSISGKTFGNDDAVVSFLQYEITSTDKEIGKAAFLALLRISLNYVQPFLSITWNIYDELRILLVTTIIETRHSPKSDPTLIELKILSKALLDTAISEQLRYKILVYTESILSLPDIELTLEKVVFGKDQAQSVRLASLKLLLRQKKLDEIRLFKRALLSPILETELVVALASELTPEGFKMISEVLIVYCDDSNSNASESLSNASIISIMRNGNAELLTRVYPLVDASNMEQLLNIVPALSRNTHSYKPQQLLCQLLKHDNPGIRFDAACSLLAHFLRMHQSETSWVLMAEEIPSAYDLLAFLTSTDSAAQTITPRNLNIIIKLCKALNIDTFDILLKCLKVETSIDAIDILRKLVENFSHDPRIVITLIEASRSSNESLVIEALFTMAKTRQTVYQTAILDVTENIFVKKALGVPRDEILSEIAKFLNMYQDSRSIKLRNLVLYSIKSSYYYKNLAIIDALQSAA